MCARVYMVCATCIRVCVLVVLKIPAFMLLEHQCSSFFTDHLPGDNIVMYTHAERKKPTEQFISGFFNYVQHGRAALTNPSLFGLSRKLLPHLSHCMGIKS